MKNKILKAIEIVAVSIVALYLLFNLSILIIGGVTFEKDKREFCHALPDEEVEAFCLTQNVEYGRLLNYAFPTGKTTRAQVSAALEEYYDSSSSYYPLVPGGMIDVYLFKRGLGEFAYFYYNDQEILLKIDYVDW